GVASAPDSVRVTNGVSHPYLAVNVRFSGYAFALIAYVTGPNSFVCPTFHGQSMDDTNGPTEPGGIGNVAFRQSAPSVEWVSITRAGSGSNAVPTATSSA